MSPIRIGLVLEQALGHVSHSKNIDAVVSNDETIDATLMRIPFEVDGIAGRVPGFGNWTVRAGIRARRALRSERRQGRQFDALFVHTQVPAVLIQDHFGKVPTVVSIDATPQQYDELGEHYGHSTSNRLVERLKWRANRRCFDRAQRIVAWSHWAKHGLIDGYGIEADKIHVIPPGVRFSQWSRTQERGPRAGPVRILFVGGDLVRKGGDDLLNAFRRLRDDLDPDSEPSVELHLVTGTAIPAEDGVVVHGSMAPNSDELIALYHSADIFCLPTLGDCLPMVLSEAGAAGLALVSTTIGAIPEIVDDGRTGFTVPVHDVEALRTALHRLVVNDELRHRLGENARELVRRRFDADTNVGLLVSCLREVADGH